MTQIQDAPVYDGVAAETEEAAGNRRVLVLLGVVAALLLAAAGWFLLGGGGSDDENIVSGLPVVRPPVATKPTAAPKPAVTLPPVSTAKLGRDPFRAQYVVPAPVAVAPDGTTGGTTGSTTGGGTGGGTPTTENPPVAATYALQLARVDGSGSDLTAKFLVGSSKKIQYARAGSTFGQTQEIRLLSIQRNPNGTGTAVVQVGDDTPFDMHTGDGAIFVQ